MQVADRFVGELREEPLDHVRPARGTFAAVPDLIAAIDAYLAANNTGVSVFSACDCVSSLNLQRTQAAR